MSGSDQIVGGPAPVGGPDGLPHPSAAASWWRTAAGHLVHAWEQTQFDRELADVFGFHAVQLGLEDWSVLQANRMPHRVVVTRLAGASMDLEPQAGLESASTRPQRVQVEHFACLPFASDSLDLVVAPHALEGDVDARQILREIERVLRPDGRLVLSGFNPVSLWGARRWVGSRPAVLQCLGESHWIGVPRLKDWFALLGLECQPIRHGVYRPPLSTETWLARTRFLEQAGDRWWPICGAAYVAVAIKRVPAIRLLGPAFKRKALQGRVPVLGTRRESGPVR